jgi:hypothetical protein
MALTGALRMMSGQLGVGRVHDEEVERPVVAPPPRGNRSVLGALRTVGALRPTAEHDRVVGGRRAIGLVGCL